MKQNNAQENWKIPLYKIYTDDEDVRIITKIVRRGSSWAIGPEIEEFENSIKNYVNCDYCLTLNSGTSALHSALLAFGFGKSDEIIVPSFTFISTVNSTQFVGSTPVFCDIENETFGLDPNLISSKISDKTKAIIPMDYGGQSCKIDDIKKIAEKFNLKLIEDAAEGLGSTIDGKKVGSITDTAILGVLVGVGIAVKVYWEKIKYKLSNILTKGKN